MREKSKHNNAVEQGTLLAFVVVQKNRGIRIKSQSIDDRASTNRKLGYNEGSEHHIIVFTCAAVGVSKKKRTSDERNALVYKDSHLVKAQHHA